MKVGRGKVDILVFPGGRLDICRCHKDCKCNTIILTLFSYKVAVIAMRLLKLSDLVPKY
jgi:hypothetical protein